MSALVGDRQGKQIEIHAAVSVSITRGYVMIIEGTVPLHNSGPEGGPLRNFPGQKWQKQLSTLRVNCTHAKTVKDNLNC